MREGEIVIYKAKNGEVEIKTRLENDSIWLSQKQIAELFDTERSVITRHLNNVFKSGELEEKCNVQKMHIADSDKPVKFYNLDAIISVGYRVNSRKATDFRIWSNKIIKQFLVKGYTINEKKLLEYRENLIEFQKTIKLLGSKAGEELFTGKEKDLIGLIDEYAKSWKVLESFDEKNIKIKKLHRNIKFEISYDGSLELVNQMRDGLSRLRLNVYLFGNEVGEKLRSTIGCINQTFDGADLYRSVEEKAANLLYLTIKDHPFSDGNKRIGSMLFLYFLEANEYLYAKNGDRKISDNAIIALALLIATSNPAEKNDIIKLIINLIQE